MRAVIAIAVILLILGFVGWLQFSSSDGDPTIRVDTDKIQQDTSEVVDKTKEAFEGMAEQVDE
ncbi:MAG: hypothetical protein R3C53_22540 [Pirellulaceae bacterium]